MSVDAVPGDWATSFDALIRAGDALIRDGKPAEVLVHYERATTLNPNHPLGWNGRGVALDEVERVADSLASFEKALSLAPRYAVALANKGRALRLLGRPLEGLAAIRVALEYDPRHAYGWNTLGMTHLTLKRNAEATAAYERALQLLPTNKQFLTNLKKAESALSASEEADFDRALEINPASSRLWLEKAQRQQNMGHVREALASYECAIALDGREDAWKGKADLLRRRGFLRAARAAERRSLPVDYELVHDMLPGSLAAAKPDPTVSAEAERLATYAKALLDGASSVDWFEGTCRLTEGKAEASWILERDRGRTLRARSLAGCAESVRAGDDGQSERTIRMGDARRRVQAPGTRRTGAGLLATSSLQ